MNNKSLEDLREILHGLLSAECVCLYEGDILRVSQDLDEIINIYMVSEPI
jgi:hypothetical protein